MTVERLGRKVLHDLSVRISEGDCLSIIGPNGAGKSTLMTAMLGLVPIAGGRVRLDGSDIRRLHRREIARRIAYVPQIHDGYMGFRVHDVIESGRYAHLDPLSPLGPADRKAVDEAVAICRIEELLDRRVDNLSGGERQKVWIAAALAQTTPALFLDEPTTALDPAHQVELIRIMRSFLRNGGTLVVICHDLNLPIMLGGRVLALLEGKFFFDESIETLQDTERLRKLFGTSFVVHREPENHGVSVQLLVEES